jgi:multiple sugar transport system substrate-binding protein
MKDEALEVIAYLLSDEAQTTNARTGRMTVLAKEDIRNQFGKDLDYDGLVHKTLRNALKEAVINKKDINTALREAEEAANKAIQEKHS